MFLYKQKSIKTRLTFSLATVITLFMLSFSMALIVYNTKSIEKELQTQIKKLSDFSKESLSIALWQYNYDYINEYMNSLFLYDKIIFATVLVKNKEIVKKTLPQYRESIFSEFKTSDNYIAAETTIIHKDVIVGTVRLVLSKERIRELVISASSLLILILLLVNLVIFGTNLIVSNAFLFKPLSKLEASVKAISKGELNTVIDTGSDDEIGQLAQSFDQMMVNLKKITASRDELNHEISERKKIQVQLQTSLEEKEVLFKEIHHRVKNNMQIIQSLLSLQSNEILEPEAKRPLVDSNNRIKSMALIHEILYRSDDMTVLDIKTYFDAIVQHLFKIYNNPGEEPQFIMNVSNLNLGMDRSIACGLIINELVSNALKYAYVSPSKGRLHLSLKNNSENHAVLRIQDDGKGFPSDLDLNTSDSLGLKIVKVLVKGQLKGHMKVKNDDGALFEIYFPL